MPPCPALVAGPRGQPGWVIGLLVSSYALLIPGLFSRLFKGGFSFRDHPAYDVHFRETTLIDMTFTTSGDYAVMATTPAFLAILFGVFSMAVPLVSLVMLVGAQYLGTSQHEASTLWARRCVAVSLAVSKWACPPMFVCIFSMFLVRGAHLDDFYEHRFFKGSMNLDLGFTCFCLFCVGSRISSLGIRCPSLKDEDSASKKRGKPQVGVELAVVLLFAVGFGVLLKAGFQKPSIVAPSIQFSPSMAVPFRRSIPGIWMSVKQCIGALTQWSAHGEINNRIACVLYLGFAIVLPALDMVLLLTGAVLHWGESKQAARVLKVSQKVRKLAMLDVSIMGCFMATLPGQHARYYLDGYIYVGPGLFFLLGAEVCHYAAGFVMDRTHARLVSDAQSQNAKTGQALETPQQSNMNLECPSTPASLACVQIDDLEHGVEGAAAPQSAASDMGAIVSQSLSDAGVPVCAAALVVKQADIPAVKSAGSLAVKRAESPVVKATACMSSLIASRTTDPVWAAISLEQLNAVRKRAKLLLGARYAEATMYLINQLIIQPACEAEQKSYAHIVNAGALRRVEVFVSHAWAENFDEFVNSVNKMFHACPVKPNLWICAFALVQSSNPKVIQQQVGLNQDPSAAPFTRALRKAEKVLIVRNRAVDLYSRIWCCWELAAAAEHGFLSRSGALMVAGPAAFSKNKVDVAHAEASNEDDKVKILRHILNKGSYGDVNKMLTQVQNHVAEIG